MKKPLITLACLASLLPAVPMVAQAADETPGDTPATFNLAATTDYRYRGISQSRVKPAAQAGVDKAFASGFYLGAWASTIRWVKDAGGGATAELDLYGGYKGQINKDAAYDVGVLQYVYPSASTAQFDAVYKNPNTTELYGALSFGPVTGKVSYALTNLFGNYDFAAGKSSKGSAYFDLSAVFDVSDGIMVAPHVGYQKVVNIANASYTDYSLSIFKDLNGFVPSLTVVGTNASKSFYVPGVYANSSVFLGKTMLVAAIKYNF
jgi:uncharacterized protein (TIGR02001 family)